MTRVRSRVHPAGIPPASSDILEANAIARHSYGLALWLSDKLGAVVTIEGSMVTVAGSGGEPLIKGATFLGLFNSHIHTCTAPGAPSSPPMVPLTPAVLTTKSTAQ